MINSIVDKAKQDSLTPDAVLKDLMQGNVRFMDGNMHERDYSAQIERTVDGQWPKAVVLGCIDSRVPVEHVFDQGIGDLFVARVAGNFENTDILGSMEYSCKVAGSKLVLVLGHESCGAVKAACDDVQMGNITSMLKHIKPAVEASKTDGERNSGNADFVAQVVENNVRQTVERVRQGSPILNEMEGKGDIKIVGGVYSISTGKVTLL
ncbi:MAG TPA: carbonic anhydrase [Leeuwenhoekiella sp.]|nr:carbonic anhydrase [Leeuwenhoekiella sp.]